MLSPVVKRSLSVLGALTLILPAACAGDEVLGPPDAGPCVAGRLSTEETAVGQINETSCEVWSARDYLTVRADVWSLDAKANTAYVIRYIPTDTLAGATPLPVRLSAYGRSEAGDVQFETGSSTSFNWGTSNRNRELILPVDRARPLSLRVETLSRSDSGRYVLQVSECSIRTISLDSTVSGINSTQGCLARGMLAGQPARVSFLSFPDSSSYASHDFTVRRDGGTAGVRAVLAGYGLDFSAVRDNAFRTGAVLITAAPATVRRTLGSRAPTTLALIVHADSGATIRATVSRTPTIMSPTP